MWHHVKFKTGLKNELHTGPRRETATIALPVNTKISKESTNKEKRTTLRENSRSIDISKISYYLLSPTMILTLKTKVEIVL